MTPLRILIAEDDIENLRLLMEDINEVDIPIEMISTPNGKIALKKTLEHAPDVILIDWVMPELDGIELTKQLREKEQAKLTPIIMITSKMNTKADLKQAFDAGVTDFINRPYHKLELLSRIKAAVRLSNTYKELIEEKEKSEQSLKKLTHINNELITIQNKLESELKAQKKTNHLLMETFELVKQLSNVNKEES